MSKKKKKDLNKNNIFRSVNNNIRSKYDQIDQREKDQNVNYEFDD